MKIIKKFVSLWTNIFLSLFIIFSLLSTSSMAIEPILDPMLLSALNNSIKQTLPGRNFNQEILEADIPYVLILNAQNAGITDISGLEQFVNIVSTIDLSNNNINDITPLINWVKNKNDSSSTLNIFLGNNPIFNTENYKQIYTLANMGENVHIYDYQRPGESVIDLPGFANGRPVDTNIKFDSVSSPSSTNHESNSNKATNNEISNLDKNIKEPVNTGLNYYPLVALVFVYLMVSFNKKLHDK